MTIRDFLWNNLFVFKEFYMKISVDKKLLEIVRGDITLENTDAIVNAANSSLLGGGGVDGAIHRAGGPAIMKECREIGGCPTGEAVITTGGKLPAKYVIHTVGPVWQGGKQNEDDLLENAYKNSLLIADKNNLHSIAFPSISTGIYGFPIKRACEIALSTIINFLKENSSITLVKCILFSDKDYKVYEKELNGFLKKDDRVKSEK